MCKNVKKKNEKVAKPYIITPLILIHGKPVARYGANLEKCAKM